MTEHHRWPAPPIFDGPLPEIELCDSQPQPVTIVTPDRSLTYGLAYTGLGWLIQSLFVWWLLPVGLSPFLDVDLRFGQALAMVVAVDMLTPLTGIGVYTRNYREWVKHGTGPRK